jgi:hypothetical protein
VNIISNKQQFFKVVFHNDTVSGQNEEKQHIQNDRVIYEIEKHIIELNKINRKETSVPKEEEISKQTRLISTKTESNGSFLLIQMIGNRKLVDQNKLKIILKRKTIAQMMTN